MAAFWSGQHLGDHLVDAKRPGHGLGGRAAVAGQHHDPRSLGVELRNGFGRAVLDRVRHAQQAGERSVDRHEHHRLSTTPEVVGPRRALRRPRRRGRPSAADCRARRVRPSTRPRTPFPVNDSKPSASASAHAAVPRTGDDRGGERMLAAALERAPPAAAASDSSSLRPASPTPVSACPRVSVPVLSTTSVSTLRSTSMASAFLKSTPGRRALARRHHDRHRRRQTQCAWARDDQHRDGVDESRGPSAARARHAPRPLNVIEATAITTGTK